MHTRKVVPMAALFSLLTGCAAMEAEHQRQLDEAVALSQGAQLGNYRRVVVDRIDCTGALCNDRLEANVTGSVSKTLTEACYTVVEASEYGRYAEHYARRMARHGQQLELRGPRGGMIRFTQFAPDLRDVVVEELQLDAIVSGTFEIGQPDDVTKFRPVTYDVKMIDARNQATLWHARLGGTIMDDASAAEHVRQGASELGTAIKRKASICNLPAPQPAEFDGITIVEQEIKLRDKVFFELDSDALNQRSFAVLDRLARFLNAHKEITRVRIEGHTDDQGEEQYNLDLSTRRTESVRTYLIGKGVSAQRLEAVGKGESTPLVPNTSERNRARNRRVEFKIVSRGAVR